MAEEPAKAGPGKGKGTRPNRAKVYEHKHELEVIKARGDVQLKQDLIKYVGEDVRSQLLIVALTGSSIATVLGLYEKATAEQAVKQPGVPMPPLWAWFFAGGFNGLMVGSLVEMFDLAKTQQAASANNPYSLIGSLAAGATTVSGLAWAALFASIILGEGGLGGLLEKSGGGGFGAMASMAGAI